ncbi:MAG: glycosyltransferase family 2 protein [Acetobacteraceae bacterium]|nr:glycosyltransferase family 2 protein [Acetobacteraceae bacterium]
MNEASETRGTDVKTATCYSLIIPVYRNEETLDALLTVLRGVAASLENRLEVVFVVDGSPDRCFPILRERLPDAGFPSQLVCLSRNFGSFAAIRMGLETGYGPYYAVLAADLQEPPALIVSFFQTMATNSFDIVIGTRESRDDPLLQALPADLFWKVYRRFVQPEMPPGGVDVFGCNLVVRDALLRLRESNSTLVGLLFWLGFRRAAIPYARRPRAIGRSAWTFRRKLRYLLDSCFALTDLPITLIIGAGLIGSVASILLSMVIFIAWLVGMIPVPGYTPLILVILNSFALTMLATGTIGGYVWRTYENTKARPLYLAMVHEVYGQERRSK